MTAPATAQQILYAAIDIITSDLTNNRHLTEVPADERADYVNYCGEVICEREPFFLPEEIAPFVAAGESDGPP